MQATPTYQNHLAQISLRSLPQGGFGNRTGAAGFRPDATAWAILALEAWDTRPETVPEARERLAGAQLADGRVPILPGRPESCWPTAPAVLAWAGSVTHRPAMEKAVDFLLSVEGQSTGEGTQTPYGHDPSIPGWPWVLGTHSWVEPTCLALTALKLAGRMETDRLQDGVSLLLDRQLPGGGWNYGNTAVYANDLNPFPHTTGLALSALSTLVSRDQIQSSLDYLESQIQRIWTPLSLAWTVMGLRAWRIPVPEAENRILQVLDSPGLADAHTTSDLALLLVAGRAEFGLEKLISNQEGGA